MNLNECEWTPDTEYGSYETTCGNAFTFNDGTPADNKFVYCPYCGCKIKEQKA